MLRLIMKHSSGHIIEMSWSFATEWIKAIHMFEYRLLHNLPEDRLFEHKAFRDDIDFHCFLILCRRLERAIIMAYNMWGNTAEKKRLKEVLGIFKTKTLYLAVLRNVGEHFDDYLLQKGRDKSIDSRDLRIYSLEFKKSKVYKVKWLNYEINLHQGVEAADALYKDFIVIYRRAIARRKALRSHWRNGEKSFRESKERIKR